MENKIKEKIKEIIINKEVDGFLGLRKYFNYVLPYLFTEKNLEDLEEFFLDEVKYPLSKIILKIKKFYPDKKLGILVRGCDEKHLIELHKFNQINLKELYLLGINCSENMALKCECSSPYVRIANISFGEKIKGKEIENPHKDLSFWMEKFSRCIKCYGCRNICPLCFCNNCTLEEDLLVKRGFLPVDYPLFHLIRAYHLGGRCINCGLCEETCPAEIPLRKLYREINEKFYQIFNYKPGENLKDKYPLEFLEEIKEGHGI